MRRLIPVGSAETIQLHRQLNELLLEFATHNQTPKGIARLFEKGLQDIRVSAVSIRLMILVQKWLDETRVPNPVEAFIEQRFQILQKMPRAFGTAEGVEATCWAWLDIYAFARTGSRDDDGPPKTPLVRQVVEEVGRRLYPKKGCWTIAGIVDHQEKDDKKAAEAVARAYLECFQEYRRRLDAPR